MKPYKTTWTDEDGKKEQRGFRNKIKRTLLGESSEWYKENRLKPLQEEFEEQEKVLEHDSKIQETLRKMAEERLKKEEES